MHQLPSRRGLSRTLKLAAAVPAALVLVTSPREAFAYDAEVDASVDAQFYTLRSPFGDPIVRRRRYTQTLGVAVYDIQGEPIVYGPQLSFRARMRLDSDFGQEGAERDPARSERFVPGLEQAPIDLMYAYLEGRNYAGGWLGFRAGRQYVTDALGFWSFDGALVRVTTPVFLQFEAYGGFEQRGGLPMLSTSRWEADGVYRGDRTDLELEQWPQYLEESKLAPAWGFAVETAGVHWIHGRLSYRRVINRDTVVVSPWPDASDGFRTVGGSRVSTERLGYALRLDEAKLGALSGSVVYDFYNQRFSEYQAALDWYATERITLGAEHEYYLPTFDGDSIFNWFTHEGMSTTQGRATVILSRRLDLSGSGGVRTFRTEGSTADYLDTGDRAETGTLHDLLGSLGGRYRWQDGSVGLRGMGETGQRGHRVGADVTTTKTFDEGFYDALLVLSLYDWKDELRPTRDATSFTYVLGGGVSPFDRTRMGVEFEHSMNRLVGQRYRVLATLDLTVLK
jgi:hypothetical protein